MAKHRDADIDALVRGLQAPGGWARVEVTALVKLARTARDERDAAVEALRAVKEWTNALREAEKVLDHGT